MFRHALYRAALQRFWWAASQYITVSPEPLDYSIIVLSLYEPLDLPICQQSLSSLSELAGSRYDSPGRPLALNNPQHGADMLYPHLAVLPVPLAFDQILDF